MDVNQHSAIEIAYASPQTDGDVWTELNRELNSPITLVHEIALKNNLNVVFVVLSKKGPSDMDIFLTECRIGDLPITVGKGNSKKISKKRSAEKMLAEFSKLGLLTNTNTTNKVSMKRSNLIKVNSDRNADYAEEMDPISRLNQIQQANKEKVPVYNVIEERGPPRRRKFVIAASVNGHISTGVGPNKKIAKRSAAEALLTLLGYTNSHAPQSASKPVIKTKGKLGSSKILNSGSSSAPVEAKKSGQAQAPKKSPQVTQSVRAEDQLLYLAQLLGVQVQFSDFPKDNHEMYLTLVSLSTTPPQIYHGEGPTTETSHEKAALEALNGLSELSLDSVTPNKENVDSVHGGSTAKPQVIPKAEPKWN